MMCHEGSVNASRCLFCGGDGPYTTVNHLLPHSLGGVSNMELPRGITCDRCNQYFGSKVECEALHEFPLDLARLFYSIPTKKGGCIKVPSSMGSVTPSGISDIIGLNPPKWVPNDAIPHSGKLILLAEPSGGRIGITKSRRCLCRLLLKMGVELIALGSLESARSEKVAAARETARAPRKGCQWTYHISISPEWAKEIGDGLTFDDYLESVEISIRESQWVSSFVLETRSFTLRTPLFEHLPDFEETAWGPWDFYVPVRF